MTQGIGAFGSGLGSAGFDPVLSPSSSNVSNAPVALLFDPATRDFRMGSDGRFVSIDPVDQEVVLALWLRKGSVGSAPESGSDIRNIERQGGPGFVGQVQDMVRNALRAIIERGDINVLKIEIIIPQRGTTFVFVNYVNNRLSTPGNQVLRTAQAVL